MNVILTLFRQLPFVCFSKPFISTNLYLDKHMGNSSDAQLEERAWHISKNGEPVASVANSRVKTEEKILIVVVLILAQT